MGILAKVFISITLSAALASADSCESGSCVEDETSFVQMKQTLKHGSERAVDEDEVQESAARIAGAKMEYWRSLIEQDLVMEQYAASKAWVDAGIATSNQELKRIENAKSNLRSTAERKENALELVWKGQLGEVADIEDGNTDEKAKEKVTKKAETHAEKAMVHELAELFVEDGKKREKNGKAAIERVTARDKLMDQAAAVAGKTNLQAFLNKADAQLKAEEAAIMSKSKGHTSLLEEYKPDQGEQEFDLSKGDQESLMQVESGVASEEVPQQQQPDQAVALEAVGALAEEARKSYYGEAHLKAEAHLKLASAKMMYKKALIERKLKIRELKSSEERTKKKLQKQSNLLKMFTKRRDRDMAKAKKKSKLAQAAWEGEAARTFLLKEVAIPEQTKKEAEKSAREIVIKRLEGEQKANYMQLINKRSHVEKNTKKAIEAFEDDRQKHWPTTWKDLLDEVKVLVGVKESLIKSKTDAHKDGTVQSWDNLMEMYHNDVPLEFQGEEPHKSDD